MKTVFLLVCLTLTAHIAIAQDCNCQQDFEFVVNYYEENLPGFMDNVTENNQRDYNEFKNELLHLSKRYCNDQDLCFKTLLIYVEFFKDNHSSIYSNSSVIVDESNADEVNQFLLSDSFKRCEIVKDFISTSGNLIDEIENTYRTKDAAYTVAIVKNKNTFRDYVGIITDSKTPLWQKGQVKFELKEVGEDTYDMFLYMRDHSLRYYKNVKLEDGVLNDSWYNVNLDELKSYNIDIASNGLTFEELSDEVNYMYLPTFDGSWYDDISRFYQKHDATIKAKPYLIIDVRNNGGGSDACASHLLQYMYTKPFQSDEVEVFATEENIRKSSEWYEEMKEDTLNFSRDFLEDFAEEIATMRSVPTRTFIPRSTGELVTLDSILMNPKKVIIISNKYCASSCETLLFWAMESDKTMIVGENSGGYVGYGEISSVPTPAFKFELGCTMTRYNHQRKYEANGVPPAVYLNNEKDWLEQALDLLEEN